MISTTRVIVVAAVFLLPACGTRGPSAPPSGPTTVTIPSGESDAIPIQADLYLQASDAPMIILLHQGESNGRAEYRNIVPKLLDAGFSLLVPDLPQGGQLYGEYNRTVAALQEMPEYCGVEADVSGIATWARKQPGVHDIILWGSSYSGTLAIRVAVHNGPAVRKVLAFLPASGSPMAACSANDLLGDLEQPLLLVRPASEMEIESVQMQFNAANAAGHRTMVADGGVHGSSMLDPARSDADTDALWATVLSFLEE